MSISEREYKKRVRFRETTNVCKCANCKWHCMDMFTEPYGVCCKAVRAKCDNVVISSTGLYGTPHTVCDKYREQKTVTLFDYVRSKLTMRRHNRKMRKSV